MCIRMGRNEKTVARINFASHMVVKQFTFTNGAFIIHVHSAYMYITSYNLHKLIMNA